MDAHFEMLDEMTDLRDGLLRGTGAGLLFAPLSHLLFIPNVFLSCHAFKHTPVLF
jgi:hypothetical protein